MRLRTAAERCDWDCELQVRTCPTLTLSALSKFASVCVKAWVKSSPGTLPWPGREEKSEKEPPIIQWCKCVCLAIVQCVSQCTFWVHITVRVHILSAHRSAGERGSVSPGRPRGRRRSSDEDGARDVDYRKHKLSKNASWGQWCWWWPWQRWQWRWGWGGVGESLGGAAAPSRQPAICPSHHSHWGEMWKILCHIICTSYVQHRQTNFAFITKIFLNCVCASMVTLLQKTLNSLERWQSAILSLGTRPYHDVTYHLIIHLIVESFRYFLPQNVC